MCHSYLSKSNIESRGRIVKQPLRAVLRIQVCHRLLYHFECQRSLLEFGGNKCLYLLLCDIVLANFSDRMLFPTGYIQQTNINQSQQNSRPTQTTTFINLQPSPSSTTSSPSFQAPFSPSNPTRLILHSLLCACTRSRHSRRQNRICDCCVRPSGRDRRRNRSIV